MPDWLMSLLLYIIPLTGGTTGYVLWRQDRRRGPIEWRTAALAESTAVSRSATELVAELRERMRDMNARLTAQDERIGKQDDKIAAQQLELNAVRRDSEAKGWLLTLWTHWYTELVEDWEELRAEAVPPAPPSAQ